jgi:hypothetical protein
MIECIFTIDYEIYGNGKGSLKELIYEPARQLKTLFDNAGAKFVVFVEAAEFEKIETFRADSSIGDVKRQIREFHEQGFEIGLHLHPQWCNARYQNGKWVLDYSEYNLCPLRKERITEIVEGAIAYLRDVLGAPDFTPVSFRAGNWLFQPTRTAAEVLAENGIKIDSSVFKGGLQYQHNMDYRPAPANEDCWWFKADAATPDPAGLMLEVPIYTQQVPFWRMLTGKRVGLQQKSSSGPRPLKQRLYRCLDLMRWSQPLKFDFCRMTLKELIGMTERAVQEKQNDNAVCRPMVAIGHTKDLVDFETVGAFLAYLKDKEIRISVFEDLYRRCGIRLENRPSAFALSSHQQAGSP